MKDIIINEIVEFRDKVSGRNKNINQIANATIPICAGMK
jgi:hypothetical protein